MRDSQERKQDLELFTCIVVLWLQKSSWKLFGENDFGHLDRAFTMVWSNLKCCVVVADNIREKKDAILAVPQLGE